MGTNKRNSRMISPRSFGKVGPGGTRKSPPDLVPLRPADRRVLQALPPPLAMTAGWRLYCLQRLWAVDRAKRGRGRCQTRAEVAAALTAENPDQPVSTQKLERWQTAYTKAGVRGLIGVRGAGIRPKRGAESLSGVCLATASPAELVQEAERLLALARERLPRKKGNG